MTASELKNILPMKKNFGLCCDLKVKSLLLQIDMAVIEAKRSDKNM